MLVRRQIDLRRHAAQARRFAALFCDDCAPQKFALCHDTHLCHDTGHRSNFKELSPQCPNA